MTAVRIVGLTFASVLVDERAARKGRRKTVTKAAMGVIGLLAVVLVTAFVFLSGAREGTSGVAVHAAEPLDSQLAAKAQASCWFKVKNRSSRSDELRRWNSVSAVGTRTERLGELIVVTGGLEPAVGDDHFYGCSLFEYTKGSPVVMTATTSPSPIRAGNVIPFGFSPSGEKLQQ
jgi:hypothetical protein